MPLYACKCTECGKRDEVFLPLAKYKDLPFCCDKQMQRVLTPLHVIEDMKPYRSPLDGTVVKSRTHHKQHMKKHGVVEVGNEKLTRPAQKQYSLDDPAQDIKKTLEQLERK